MSNELALELPSQLCTYTFEKQYLENDGYEIIQRYQIQDFPLIIAQKKDIKFLFVVYVRYRGEIIALPKDENAFRVKVKNVVYEEAVKHNAFPMRGVIDVSEDIKYFLNEGTASGKITILHYGEDKKIYVSEPLAAMVYKDAEGVIN